MPRFDQSGPDGKGAAIGKNRGMCQRTDYSAFTDLDKGDGRGQGRGRGLGQCAIRQRSSSTGLERMPSPVSGRVDTGNEITVLKRQYESAREMMEELQEKIAAMEAQQK